MKTKKPVTKRSRHSRPRAPTLQFNPLSPIIEDVMEAHNRLPADPRARLAWAVNLAWNIGRLPKDELDKRKLKAEIYAFIGVAGLPVPASYIIPHAVDIDVLKRWYRMIQSAINRTPVEVVPSKIGTPLELWERAKGKMLQRITLRQTGTILRWSPQSRRFLEEVHYPGDLETSAARALGKLLVDNGHLVKECPAPRLRGNPGELCENWFVASRPNKRYCSSACQSRATTTGKRNRDQKKQSKKKKPKK